MGRPTDFEGSNHTVKGGMSADLPVLAVLEPDILMISCWEFTDHEIDSIVETGKVWLTVNGRQPPVILMGRKPFWAAGEGPEQEEYESTQLTREQLIAALDFYIERNECEGCIVPIDECHRKDFEAKACKRYIKNWLKQKGDE